jgi:hypothetical protein
MMNSSIKKGWDEGSFDAYVITIIIVELFLFVIYRGRHVRSFKIDALALLLPITHSLRSIFKEGRGISSAMTISAN